MIVHQINQGLMQKLEPSVISNIEMNNNNTVKFTEVKYRYKSILTPVLRSSELIKVTHFLKKIYSSLTRDVLNCESVEFENTKNSR